jgi:CHASE2 domain-containing sensor protein
VLIADVEQKHSDRPRFDKRSIFAGLIIWCFALSLAGFLYVYAAFHPPSPGERDLGEGVLLFTGFFAAIIIFLAGAMSMVLGLVHFLWLSWRFSRRTTSIVTIN